jgi:PsbN protein
MIKGFLFNKFLIFLNMESPAFFFTIFLWCFLLSVTAYSIYVGFGPPSKNLRDPFEEHED